MEDDKIIELFLARAEAAISDIQIVLDGRMGGTDG